MIGVKTLPLFVAWSGCGIRSWVGSP